MTKGPVEDLIARAGGCVIIDGGFATQLEIEGADITDPLWSAVCLISNPDLITKVRHFLFNSVSSLRAFFLCWDLH